VCLCPSLKSGHGKAPPSWVTLGFRRREFRRTETTLAQGPAFSKKMFLICSSHA
jgi:hypothetical protein